MSRRSARIISGTNSTGSLNWATGVGPRPCTNAARRRSRLATPSTSSTPSPRTTHQLAPVPTKVASRLASSAWPGRVGAETRGTIRSRAVRSLSWNTLAIMAASSASIWPFWEPSRANRRISSSSVVSSFSAVMAGINRSSSSTIGSISFKSRLTELALARATGRAKRLPRALGRISPSRITSRVRPIENRGRAMPLTPWLWNTWAA